MYTQKLAGVRFSYVDGNKKNNEKKLEIKPGNL